MIVALWRKQIKAYEILPKGTTVDHLVYLNFLERRLLPEVQRKKFVRPIILHDNAKPHKHRVIREYLQAKGWEELGHPPYSPDMSPPDINGIALIKAPNKWKQFLTETELINDYDATTADINKNHESKGVDMLPDRWRAITIAHGGYVV
jgi:histone-lysine N-methyltransferase SETMAR